MVAEIEETSAHIVFVLFVLIEIKCKYFIQSALLAISHGVIPLAFLTVMSKIFLSFIIIWVFQNIRGDKFEAYKRVG